MALFFTESISKWNKVYFHDLSCQSVYAAMLDVSISVFPTGFFSANSFDSSRLGLWCCSKSIINLCRYKLRANEQVSQFWYASFACSFQFDLRFTNISTYLIFIALQYCSRTTSKRKTSWLRRKRICRARVHLIYFANIEQARERCLTRVELKGERFVMENNNCKWGGVEAKMKKTFMSEVR